MTFHWYAEQAAHVASDRIIRGADIQFVRAASFSIPACLGIVQAQA